MRRNDALALTVVALAVLTGCSSGPTGATPDNRHARLGAMPA